MSATRTPPPFADLVFNEEDRRAKELRIVGEVFYAIPDGDFSPHVEATTIDRPLVALPQRRIRASGEVVTDGIIKMLANERRFTRASIGRDIDHVDQIPHADEADPDQLRTALRVSGFRVIVDVHGDQLRLQVPGWVDAGRPKLVRLRELMYTLHPTEIGHHH